MITNIPRTRFVKAEGKIQLGIIVNIHVRNCLTNNQFPPLRNLEMFPGNSCTLLQFVIPLDPTAPNLC